MWMITKNMVLTESRVEKPPENEPRHFRPYPGESRHKALPAYLPPSCVIGVCFPP